MHRSVGAMLDIMKGLVDGADRLHRFGRYRLDLLNALIGGIHLAEIINLELISGPYT